MQHELRVLEQRWGLASQSASFGVWDLDPRRQEVHYSPQWKAMLGYGDADEADSTATWRSRVHPDDLAPMLAALGAHLEARTAGYEMEFRLRAADGSYRWVLSRGRVVDRDEQGAPLRVVGTLTDLTDRKQAEALRLAYDRVEAASRAKSEFLSRMSHELRTPLNAVLGFAQLLSQRIGRAEAEEQRRCAAEIEKAGWHLLTLINNVLDLSQVEDGQLGLQIEPVRLAPLLQAAHASMASMAGQHAVQLRGVECPRHATVLADPERVRQVLTNLLSNAIKYNRRGGVVAVEVQPAAGSWKLVVADTGMGIAADQMPHLFEPFNRLGRAGSGIDGVGIGLLLCRWLVDKMGGVLAVQSREGEGTAVEVLLPDAACCSLPCRA